MTSPNNPNMTADALDITYDKKYRTVAIMVDKMHYLCHSASVTHTVMMRLHHAVVMMKAKDGLRGVVKFHPRVEDVPGFATSCHVEMGYPILKAFLQAYPSWMGIFNANTQAQAQPNVFFTVFDTDDEDVDVFNNGFDDPENYPEYCPNCGKGALACDCHVA